MSKLHMRLGALVCLALFAACGTDEDSGVTPGPDAGTDGPSSSSSSSSTSSSSSGGMDSGKDAADAADAAKPPECGRNTTPCKEGDKCDGPPDCESKICQNNKCGKAGIADGVKNGDETDVDCGGKAAPACDDGKACLIKDDCNSGVCTGNVCQVPTPTDGVKNGDETDIDCGGANAPDCGVGKGCKTNDDCDKLQCDPVQKKCNPASYTDGVLNQDETDIDCGGNAPNRCAVGKTCNQQSDCNNVLCAGTCQPPSPTDGLKNGTETDVDCGGGGGNPICKSGKVCVLDTDCEGGCNYANKCVTGKSCKMNVGGDTCGTGEDCCTSNPLPNGTARVDKYEITAGRMRAFIAAVNNNVQKWVTDNRAITGDIPDAMVQYLPTGLDTPTVAIKQCNQPNGNCVPQGQGGYNPANFPTVNQRFGVRQHLGNNVFMPDRPCQNCGQGCWLNTGAGQNGHPTYWWDATTQTNQFGAMARAFTQAELDVKSLNCTPQLLFAAFCAWDGGRLPTQPELGGTNGAWGPGPMPWGATNTSWRDVVDMADAPNRTAYPFTQDNGTCPGGNTCFAEPMLLNIGAGGTYNAAAATRNWTNWNPFPSSPAVFVARHVFPKPANTATNDHAYAIASPGRMRRDFRQSGPNADDGWYDVGANLIEATSTGTGTDDADHNGFPRVSWVGGSFEGHTPNNRGGYNLSVLTKYGKQGARCARSP